MSNHNKSFIFKILHSCGFVVTLSNSITSACLLGMAFFHFCSYNCKTRLCESVYFDWQTRKNDCKKLTKQPAPHITLRLQQNFDLGAGSNILASVAFLVPVYLVFASCSWEGGGCCSLSPSPSPDCACVVEILSTSSAFESLKFICEIQGRAIQERDTEEVS